MLLFVLGGAFVTAGYNILAPCNKAKELANVDVSSCIELAESTMSFGEAFQTSMGINVVLAAVVMYFLVNYAPIYISPIRNESYKKLAKQSA